MPIIKVKRGLQANLPSTGLNAGEFLFATDTGNLYICKDTTTRILLASGGSLSDYLLKSQNLNDLPNKATSRTNLDVYSKAETDTADGLRMLKSQNLNDVANKATSRTNLDVYSKAETDAADNLRMLKTQNLNDVANKTTARNNLEVYSKAEVDQIISGLKWKQPVRVATTGTNITLSNIVPIDGLPTAVGDRVLVKDQTDKKQNGIYVVASGAWTRATDADTAEELLNASVFVSQGLINADTAFVCTTDNISIGTSNIEWAQFAGTNTYTGGFAIEKDGNAFNLNLDDLTAKTTLAAGDFIVFIDVAASGTARYKKITKTNFFTTMGIVNDTFKVKVTSGGADGFLDERLMAQTGLIKEVSGNNLDLHLALGTLPEVTTFTPAVNKFLPVVDQSATPATQQKVTLDNLLANAVLDGGTF